MTLAFLVRQKVKKSKSLVEPNCTSVNENYKSSIVDVLISSKRKVGRPALAKRALLRQPLQSILEADNNEFDENEALDDDIEYYQLQYTQIINEQNNHLIFDHEYTLRFNYAMDVTMANPFDYIDINNDMFGLMQHAPTTSISTPNVNNIGSMYTISHISNIVESNESPTFKILRSYSTLLSIASSLTSSSSSTKETQILKRKNKETKTTAEANAPAKKEVDQQEVKTNKLNNYFSLIII